MNHQLQTKAMALLTALLQGASPTERKVSPQGLNEEQQLVCAVLQLRARNHLNPLLTHCRKCLTTYGRRIFANSSTR